MSLNASIADLSTKPDGYYTQSRPDMLPFIPRDAKRILDVGCGQGGFASKLKELLGAEVWGIEYVPAAAEVARRHLDRVLVGDVMQRLDQLPDCYFDCITFTDVLEHLIDPYRVLLEMKQKLSPEGVIVASIPNIRFFPYLFDLVVRGSWNYEDQGILDKTHLRFFTKKSILEMFQSLGYRIIRLEGINGFGPKRKLLLNVLTLWRMSDTAHLQFACVVQPLKMPKLTI